MYPYKLYFLSKRRRGEGDRNRRQSILRYITRHMFLYVKPKDFLINLESVQ